MDWDGDGVVDILSRTCSDEIYWFRGLGDSRFDAGKPLADSQGHFVSLDSVHGVFAVDWNSDGRLDLLLGTTRGEIFLVLNVGDAKNPVFDEPRPMEADGKRIKIDCGYLSPVAADWDGDGRLDLLVGAYDGSVLWYRNNGVSHEPSLAAPEVLVSSTTLPGLGTIEPEPTTWGYYAKICVADFNGDGLPDLLLGDASSGFEGKLPQSLQEKKDEEEAIRRLPEIMKAWAEHYQTFRALTEPLQDETFDQKEIRERKRSEVQKAMKAEKAEITAIQRTIDFYRPQRQSHGYVWLFLRKPAEKTTALKR